MPPKGWRKNTEGSHPVSTKERDQISIDDILFPRATVTRIARSALTDGGLISKDSALAIQRSATVFVSYLLVSARQNTKKFDRKVVGPQDIIAALENTEFASFIPHIQTQLDKFQIQKEIYNHKKREKYAAERSAKEKENAGNDTVDDNDNEKKRVGQKESDDDENSNNDKDEDQEEAEDEDESDDEGEDENEETQNANNEEPQVKKLKKTKTDREDTVSEKES
ncbi:hypothetical protein WICMUC_001441 [Wickerhamomyces mucosus]|uniref:DNA polymerase epsilon subunit D n=1 Tax=Wickerhamomyces mucosus TaxID=1378264 RepID=A0A9P8TGZ0_9ASCO|nr:hypothetical protein WICMUC_001441 [Wickerhamomyces mucosus]